MLKSYCRPVGIYEQFTTAYTQLNEVAEERTEPSSTWQGLF